MAATVGFRVTAISATAVVAAVGLAALLTSPWRPAGIAPAPPTDALPDAPKDTVRPDQGACAPTERQTANGCITNPVIKKKIPPRYPEAARRAKISARVTARARIGADGKVMDVSIDSCTPRGKQFEEATIVAVREWEYYPALQDGRPIPFDFTVSVDFVLEDGGRPTTGPRASER